MKTFRKTFEIEGAIRWELHKTNLAEQLFDSAADDPDCPQAIRGSAYTGEVQVQGNLFVVILTEGEAA